MTRLATLLAPGLLALAATGAAACPGAADLTAADLYGLWRAEVSGRHAGTLLLEPNPRWPGSLTGTINRDGVKSQVAGDLDDGELTLEESADGTRISATWIGEPVPGSCGREFRGSWQAGEPGRPAGFVLRRADGAR